MNIPKPRTIPLYFAHRGIISEENTISAFGKALEMGAPGIELDVHFYYDRLKVTHYKTLVARESTPYLNDVLDFIYDKCKKLKRDKPILNIDLKSRGSGKLVLQHMKGKWKPEDFLITSFMVLTQNSRLRYQELKTVRELNKDVAIGIIGYANVLSRYTKFIKELNACALITKWHSDKYTKEFVETVHKHKLYSVPWNITGDEEMNDAMGKGADGVIRDVHNRQVCVNTHE